MHVLANNRHHEMNVRFNIPQEDKLSLQMCQPLMERLVNSVGGPLCSTLMIADDLEIIAHACRSLAKLSNTNTTVQVRNAVDNAFPSRFLTWTLSAR